MSEGEVLAVQSRSPFPASTSVTLVVWRDLVAAVGQLLALLHLDAHAVAERVDPGDATR